MYSKDENLEVRYMKLKKILLTIVICLFTSSIFAVEEYVSDIYRQIDRIFAAKSETQLNTLLSFNREDKYYYLIENYTQKKIRRLIVNNDYSFAMEAILVVIENNLENEEAVEMYTVIADAFEVQKKFEESQELAKQQEIARIENEKNKQRASANKEYVSAAKTGGGSVYVTGRETKLTSYWWKAALGIADFTYVMDSFGPVNNINYGISLDFNYEYSNDKNIMGLFVFTDFKFLSFGTGKDSIPLIINLDIGPKLGFIKLSRHFFAKLGFSGMMISGMEVTSTVQNVFVSPSLGVSFERLPLGNANFGFGIDYYPGHLWTPGVNLAMGAEANVCIPFAELEKFKLNINVGVRDKFLLKSSGIENRASLILAIGVENVSK